MWDTGEGWKSVPGTKGCGGQPRGAGSTWGQRDTGYQGRIQCALVTRGRDTQGFQDSKDEQEASWGQGMGAPEECKAMGGTRQQLRTRNWGHTKDTGKDVVCLRGKG